jgi:hypothetical protein
MHKLTCSETELMPYRAPVSSEKLSGERSQRTPRSPPRSFYAFDNTETARRVSDAPAWTNQLKMSSMSVPVLFPRRLEDVTVCRFCWWASVRGSCHECNL